MYGYQPPKPEQGTWRETLMIVRVALTETFRPLLIAAGLVGLVMLALILLFVHPALALLPLAVLAGLGWHMIRRERKIVDEAIRALPPRYR